MSVNQTVRTQLRRRTEGSHRWSFEPAAPDDPTGVYAPMGALMYAGRCCRLRLRPRSCSWLCAGLAGSCRR